MNWIIIAAEKFKNQCELLAKFFNEKDNKPSVFYVTEDTILNKEVFLSELFKSTHCICVADGNIPPSPELFFANGLLIGSKIPVFVTGLSVPKEQMPFLQNYKFFSSLDDLIQNIEQNFPKYLADEEKKKAHQKLFEQGIPFTPDCFSSYIAKSDSEISQLFVDAGMSVNERDSAGTPMLCIAARSGRTEMIKWLVSLGADIDAVSKDRGYSPVMDAVWKSSTEIVELMINYGANLNFISNDGQTALIVATGATNLKICELLVKNGADPTVKDRMGMSALEYAKLFKKQSLVELYSEYVK